MRFGLLALSIAMLTSGALAAQSALAITLDATSGIAASPAGAQAEAGVAYGTLPFSGGRAARLRLAAR